LTVLAIICAAIFGAMWSLATFVQPTQTEMTIRVPTDKVNPPDPSAQPAKTP
jgi:hypothetical protein